MTIDAIQKDDDLKFYITELKSDECQCGRSKKPGLSFCPRCFYLLPPYMRTDLYQKIGHGYEESYDLAVKFLNA